MEKTGQIMGVPYDIRPPTLDRIRERIWNPDNPQIIVPRVFGAGWTINLGRLKQENIKLFWVVVAVYAVGLVNILRRIRRKMKKGC
jgi:hypothetical protein